LNASDSLFRDDHGFSPLHWAAKYGQFKIVELLLQRGARVNVVNKGDDTPLHLAAAHGHHDVVRLVSLTSGFIVMGFGVPDIRPAC